MGFFMALPDAGQITIIAGALVGILTNLIMQVMTYMREGRAHKWAKEQAEVERKERIRVAAEMKAQHEQAAMAITLNTQHAAAVLGQKIDDNTALTVEGISKSEKAIEIGNNVNEKLVLIGEARLGGTAAEQL